MCHRRPLGRLDLTCGDPDLGQSGGEFRLVRTREPSIPTETIGTEVVRGAPADPTMAARAGHDNVVATESLGPREGMIDRGDHATFHEPDESLSSSRLRTWRIPSEPSVS